MDSERRKLSLKPILLASGAVATLAVLGIILKIIGSMTKGSPQAMGESTTITLKQSTVAPPAPQTDLPETATVLRNDAWNEVQSKCGVGLKAVLNEFDDQASIARSQKWQLEARNQAQKSNGKKAEYDWLTNNSYLSFAAQIQGLTKSGQMATDSVTIKRYRDAKGALLDIAQALSSTVHPLTPNIPTLTLNRAIDACYQAASDYNALRENAAAKVRTETPQPPPRQQPETQSQPETQPQQESQPQQTEQTDGEEVQ